MKRRWTGIETVAAVWLCSLMMGSPGQGALQTAASDGWPETINGRMLSRCEYGFVYAREKSAADRVQELLATVMADVKQDAAEAPPAGLILVADIDEEYPCDPNKLTEAVKKTDPNDSRGTLKAVSAARKQAQDMGLAPETMLSVGPLPVPPAALREVVADVPMDVDRRIGWCVIVPTDECLKANFKKTMDAAMKKENPGLAKRMILRTMMPVVERQMMSMAKKARQAALYGFLLQTRNDLSPEQRQAKIDAYKEKLGLRRTSDPAKKGN
jgi:hypothetical protein